MLGVTNNSAEMRTGQDLFDAAFYAEQCGQTFGSSKAAWDHYLNHGIEAGFEPAPYFMTHWYFWQNPDARNYTCVLDHFIKVGSRRMIDPSPFLDLTQMSRRCGAKTSVDAYFYARDNPCSNEDGVFHSYQDLRQHQNAFMDKLTLEMLHDKPKEASAPARKRLVWVQIGQGSEFANWFNPRAERSWDVLCNWYHFDAVDLSLGDIGLAQRGTKFTGVANVIKHQRALLERYDQVLFLDDDLIFEFDDIDRLFDIAQSNDLALFQAALTPESYCVWPQLKAKSNVEMRRFNTVEIMMPGFATDFLLDAADVFDHSISGFGLDMALGKIAQSKDRKAGVVYSVRAQHLQPINPSSGPYYDYMRNHGINPKLELWNLIQQYQPDYEIKAISE